MLSELIKKGY